MVPKCFNPVMYNIVLNHDDFLYFFLLLSIVPLTSTYFCIIHVFSLQTLALWAEDIHSVINVLQNSFCYF